VPTRLALYLNASMPDEHILNVQVASPFLNMYADEVVTRVVLPSGAHSISLRHPLEVEEEWEEVKWGWFDTIRPRRVLAWRTKGTFIPDSMAGNLKFQVNYIYSGLAHMEKPINVSSMLLGLFIIYIACSRLTLRITKEGEGKVLDKKEKYATLLSQLATYYEQLVYTNDDFYSAAEAYIERPVKHQWEKTKTSYRSEATRIVNGACEAAKALEDEDKAQKVARLFKAVMEEAVKLANAKAAQAEETGGTGRLKGEIAASEGRLNDLEDQIVAVLEIKTKSE